MDRNIQILFTVHQQEYQVKLNRSEISKERIYASFYEITGFNTDEQFNFFVLNDQNDSTLIDNFDFSNFFSNHLKILCQQQILAQHNFSEYNTDFDDIYGSFNAFSNKFMNQLTNAAQANKKMVTEIKRLNERISFFEQNNKELLSKIYQLERICQELSKSKVSESLEDDMDKSILDHSFAGNTTGQLFSNIIPEDLDPNDIPDLDQTYRESKHDYLNKNYYVEEPKAQIYLPPEVLQQKEELEQKIQELDSQLNTIAKEENGILIQYYTIFEQKQEIEQELNEINLKLTVNDQEESKDFKAFYNAQKKKIFDQELLVVEKQTEYECLRGQERGLQEKIEMQTSNDDVLTRELDRLAKDYKRRQEKYTQLMKQFAKMAEELEEKIKELTTDMINEVMNLENRINFAQQQGTLSREDDRRFFFELQQLDAKRRRIYVQSTPLVLKKRECTNLFLYFQKRIRQTDAQYERRCQRLNFLKSELPRKKDIYSNDLNQVTEKVQAAFKELQELEKVLNELNDGLSGYQKILQDIEKYETDSKSKLEKIISFEHDMKVVESSIQQKQLLKSKLLSEKNELKQFYAQLLEQAQSSAS